MAQTVGDGGGRAPLKKLKKKIKQSYDENHGRSPAMLRSRPKKRKGSK